MHYINIAETYEMNYYFQNENICNDIMFPDMSYLWTNIGTEI